MLAFSVLSNLKCLFNSGWIYSGRSVEIGTFKYFMGNLMWIMTTDGLDMSCFLATRPTRPWETRLFLALLKLGLPMGIVVTNDLYDQMQLVGIVQHRSLVKFVKPLDLPVGIKAIGVANVVKIVRILKTIEGTNLQ